MPQGLRGQCTNNCKQHARRSQAAVQKGVQLALPARLKTWG